MTDINVRHDRFRVDVVKYRVTDFLTDYSNCDESWCVHIPRTGWGGFVHRYGQQFAISNAGHGSGGRSKAWFDSFDAAALCIQMECVAAMYRRDHDARRRRNEQRRRAKRVAA